MRGARPPAPETAESRARRAQNIIATISVLLVELMKLEGKAYE
jgi:hypothetical protein